MTGAAGDPGAVDGPSEAGAGEAAPPPYGSPTGYSAPAGDGSPPGYAAPGYGPPPGYGPAPYGASGGGPARQDDTIWAVLVHLSVFVFPLLAPLVVYLVFRDTSSFTRHHATEALNFHITLTIAGFISLLLIFVLIGIPLLIAVAIAGPVLGIIAAIAASRHELYRYPLTLHLVS